MIVHTSIGGRRVRIELSNAYGSAPLTIGSTHIALRDKESAIVAGSDRALAFNGKPSCSIPVGAAMLSDPVDLDVPALGDLAVSVYVPGDTGPATTHSVGLHTTYISKQGDVTGESALADSITSQSWYWLSGVEVLAPADAAAIVTFGDSITDGTRSTPNTDSSWPSFLARRLAANTATANLAVLNEAISANRMLRDGIGVSALSRFDRDVLGQNSVKWMFVLEGINDIGVGLGNTFVFGPRPNAQPGDETTADMLIGAYRQMISRAHDHGIRVAGGTLTPFEGAAYYSENGNKVRQAVNQWIRTGGAFDWVADFERVIQDPEHPNRFRPEFDSSDHLHPNDAGYKAMAGSIDLSIFSSNRMSASESSR
jgi:lysophospholipase L1-like esterase